MERASREEAANENPISPVFYEPLGAPLLLYRNREAYTPQDDDPRLWNAQLKHENAASETPFHSYTEAVKWFCERQSDLYRTTARFYYPIDAHLLGLPKRLPCGLNQRRRGSCQKSATHEAAMSHGIEEGTKANGEFDDQDENTMETDNEEVTSSDRDGTPATSITAHPSTKERNRMFKRMFQNDQFNQPQLFQLQHRVRGHMLLAEAGEHGDVTHRRQHVRQKLQAYTQLDANFVPAKEKLRRDRSSKPTASHFRVSGLHGIVRQQTQLYDRERLHRSQPAFLAPFHLSSLRSVVAEDIASRGIPYKKPASPVIREISSIPQDDPHSPTLFGNCLLLVPCRCGVCVNVSATEQGSTVSPCLLHPVGPLQDRVRCSYIQLPHGKPVSGHAIPRRDIPEECKVGHRTRQLELCGQDPYIVVIRTEVHCVVASITFSMPRREEPAPSHHCWGAPVWTILHRIDYRSLWRSMPSFRPLDVSCHPKYGVRSMSPSKIAVLYESSHGGTKNTIYHMQITLQAVSVQSYHILNLQEIVEIAFSSHHPMILWCIGRSCVRPALTATYLHSKRPQLGHGFSLYSIDLRCSDPAATMATLEWSPSAEEFTPEGIHSLSGLQVDWKNDHCLWVSSISAGRTYRLDTRTPCRVLHSFSLPYVCDEPGAFLQPTGLYGAGSLFSQPISLAFSSTKDELPMLNVAKTPGAHSLHIYQTPTKRPLFQIPSVESVTCPGVAQMGNSTLAASSMIPLPDVSDQIFTCGIASFRAPVHVLCSSPSSWCPLGVHASLTPDVLCIITLTNKGDVYAHILLTSIAEQRYAKAFDGLPLGYSSIPAPLQDPINPIHQKTWNTLPLRFSNDFPVPGHTIRSRERKQSDAAIIDLSSFIEKADRSNLRQERTFKKRRVNGAKKVKSEVDAEGSSLDGVNFSELKPANKAASRVVVAAGDLSRRAMVVPRSASEEPVTLFLPEHLSLETNLERSVEHFERIGNGTAERVVNKEKLWRSDLTPSILDVAWEDHSSDCSDCASMESI